MIDFNSISVIIAFLVGLVTVGVYLYGTASRGRADTIRQDNADLRASNQELRQNQAGHIATISQQTDTIKNLREVATQTPEIKELLASTAKQQIAINKQHAEVIEKLAHLAEAISNMTTEFSKVATNLATNSRAQRINSEAQDANTRIRKQA